MKVDVVMPKMGESVSEGTIIKWYKKVGEKVERDEIIFEIATDKVDTEIPSPEEGVLSEIKVYENETVEVGTVVAVLATNGDASAAEKDEKSEESGKDEKKEESSTAEVGGEVIDVTMPKMGESVMEGTIIKWNKQVGDEVDVDEILFEIATDKVDTEVPSAEKGILKEILVGENETVEVGTVVAKLETTTGVKQSEKKKTQEPKKDETESKQKEEPEKEKSKSKSAEKPKDSNKFYSPLVMNIARKENIGFDELEKLEGSGKDGRVTKKDVLSYLEDRASGKAKQKPKPERKVKESSQAPSHSDERVEVIPMDNVRQRIMEHMVNSRDTSVHVTGMIEVDMTKIHNFIKENKQRYIEEENVKLTYMPFISYASIKALKKYPFVNASIKDNEIIRKKFINLGIAVAVEPNGLIVPNIKDADEKSIIGLAKAVNQIGKKAREKKLMPDDIIDGTFTITNYGVFGSLLGTPIINQPEVAILGAGAVEKRPVVVEVDGADTIAIKPMMYLTLSHDHRLVDGMLGGKFLKEVKEVLENFDLSSV